MPHRGTAIRPELLGFRWHSLLCGQEWPLPPPSTSTAKGSEADRPSPVAGGAPGSQCKEGALRRAVKEKPGFTGGRRAACAKAQRCGKAEFGV